MSIACPLCTRAEARLIPHGTFGLGYDPTMPVAALLALSVSPSILPLVPFPQKVDVMPGVVVAKRARIEFDPAFAGAAQYLQGRTRSGDRPAISLRRQTGMAKEGYSLIATAEGVVITASEPEGALYGAVTLSQLARNGAIPCLTIEDQPRFSWRGLHLDVSRHFFTTKEIKKYLDYMAEYKLNVFHWHLVDDGGWRMESKKYPQLTEQGGWRLQRPGEIWNYGNIEFPGKNSGKPLYGGFYTQDEIRDIVRYAKERAIEVVPEIEMPGHSLPAIVALPEVGCRPGSNVFCAGKEKTFQVLEDILTETLELFPSKIIHIGGDEVDKGFWRGCVDCQRRIKDEGLKDFEELQSYFIRRIEKFLNSKGRTLMGWDEILEGGLAPNAMVMSWRGMDGGIAAAKSGHQVVMTPTSHCYFDYPYEGTSTVHVLGFDPVSPKLTEEEAKLVIGGQANVWTEWIADFDRVETMVFPRVCGLAESLWAPKGPKNYLDFDRRLRTHAQWWNAMGIDFYLDPPAAPANLIIFQNEAELVLTPPTFDGVSLKYSFNAPLPNPKAKTYTGPIPVREEGVVRAMNYRNGKPTGNVMEVTFMRQRDVSPQARVQYRLIKKAFDSLPDFNTHPIDASGECDLIDIGPFRALESFAVEFKLTLSIAQGGKYTFTLGSDDGSALYVNDARVINSNFLQGYTERTASAILAPGTYEVRVPFFEKGGAEDLTLKVRGPDGTTKMMSAPRLGGR